MPDMTMKAPPTKDQIDHMLSVLSNMSDLNKQSLENIEENKARIQALLDSIRKSNGENDKLLTELDKLKSWPISNDLISKFNSPKDLISKFNYPNDLIAKFNSIPYISDMTKLNSTPYTPNILERDTKETEKALKFDDGKVDWAILPLTALEEIIKVLKFGEKKYGRGNFASNGGLEYTRLINALLRHTTEFARGEDVDPETGLSHMAHAGCCVLFLLHSITHSDACNKDDRRDNILR